jgi:hypothetical protein
MVFAARMRLQPCPSRRKPRQPDWWHLPRLGNTLAIPGAVSYVRAERSAGARRPGPLPWIFERAVCGRLGRAWRMRADRCTLTAITIARRSIAALIDINLLDDALNKLAEAC